MPAPGIISGGTLTQIFTSSLAAEMELDLHRSRGVFGPNPGATPKYAYNSSSHKRDAEYRDTMARLFVELPPDLPMDAFLQTVAPESREIARVLADASSTGGGSGTGFIDFLMTEAQEGFTERIQIADTLTDNYVVFFSGREPSIANYAGTLLNTYQDDQRVWFLRAYSEILRGTRLAQRGMVARLRYDSLLATGYLMNLNMWLDGDTDITAARFSFQFLIKRLQVMTPTLALPTQPTQQVIRNPTRPDLDEYLLDPTPREGVLTPEVPPTAEDVPSAENLASINPVREKLRAKGLTDAQINDVLYRAQGMSNVTDIDPREKENLLRFQGVERVANMSVNPANKQNDGQGGATNVTTRFAVAGSAEDTNIFTSSSFDEWLVGAPLDRTSGLQRGT